MEVLRWASPGGIVELIRTSRIAQALILFSCSGLLVRLILCLGFGLTVGFINPFLLKISNISLNQEKFSIKIRSVRFNISPMDKVMFSIMLGDVELKIKDIDEAQEHSPQDAFKSFKNQDPKDLNPNIPLYIFPKNLIKKSLIEIYLLYFRFVGFRFTNLSIEFEQYGVTTTADHILTEIRVNRSKRKRNVGATIRILHQSINGIEIFDAFTVGVSGALDLKTGEVSRLNLDLEMRDLSVPVLSIIKTLPKRLKKNDSTWQPNRDDFCAYSLAKMNKKLYMFCYFIKLIEKVDIGFQNMSINEIPLGEMEQIQSSNYEPLVKFELKINSFALTVQRMYFDSPGYGLTYTYEDKPFHLIYNFTEISIAMQSPNQEEYKPILTLPVMNFTGSSNVFFQTLEASKNETHSDGKLLITGHISDLILDVSVDDVANIALATLDFLKVKKESQFKKGQPVTPENSKLKRVFWFGAFPTIWPKFNVKMSVENPVILVKNPILNQFYRILVLRFALISLQFRTDKNVEEDGNIIYSASQVLNLTDTRIKFRNTREHINVEVLKLDGIDLKQTINILPQVLVTSSLVSHSTLLDVSDINVLNGINILMSDLYWKIRPLVDQYKLDTGDYCLLPPVSEPKSEDNYSTTSIAEESFDDIIPPWLSHFVFISNNTEVILGSRSLLIPKELVKNIDSLSDNDLVNGELRKVGFSIEKWTVALMSQVGKTDFDSSTSSNSSLEDDDKGLLDSLADNELSKDSWNLKVESSHVLGKIHSESSQKHNKLAEKVFMKVPSSVLTLNPHPDNNNQLMVDFSLGKVDMFYSVITHFIIISSLHLLRNTVLEFSQYKKDPKVQEIPPCGPPKKKRTVKDFLNKVQVTFSIDYLEMIFVFPDKLKLRFEVNKVNALSVFNKPILLSSHYLRLCAESPTTAGYWARILTAVDGSTLINIQDILNKDTEKVWFDSSNQSCHLALPHQFIMYQVFDNISVTIKTLKQLHYSLKNNTDEIIINPHAKPAEKIPRTKLKSSRLFFCMDDDPFEAELNMIFQVGLSEQKMRYEKTKLFDARIAEELQSHRQRSTRSANSPTFLYDVHSDSPTISKRRKLPKFKPSTFSSLHHPNSMDVLFDNEKQQHGEDIGENGNTQQSQKQRSDVDNMHKVNEISMDKLYKLREGFSKSWVARVRAFKKNQEREFQQNFKFLWGNLDISRLPEDFNRKVLDFVTAPSLFSLILEGVDLELGKPSFGSEKIPDFLYDVGKGKPKDSEYSTLIPLHIDLRLEELRCHLRDYPLPFVYMPRVKGPEVGTLPAVRIHGNIVIGENTIKSWKEVREVYVPLVPGCKEFDEDNRYSIEIPKTLTSIKFYTMLDLDLNSSDTTKVTWGTSYQPCIQQIMLNLDNFTKPPIDPSDKVGFWDKIRANFHARMKFNWNRGGRFDVLFKGTKNPYDIYGKAAGFILGFKNDVVVNINEKDDPREFLVTNAQELIFAVPNHIAEPLLVWSRETERSVFLANQNTNYQGSTYGYYFDNDDTPDDSEVEIMSEHYLEKVAIRLSGGIKFNLALAFERKCDDGDERSSEFISHDEITLVNPKYVEDRDTYDAYHHFRSHFIHMGITLISENDVAYNTIQLTPSTFQHFFAFWNMFSNTFPVRHGKLFGPEKATKKFARHLYTIKYQAIASPLFITHVYHDHESDVQDQDKFVSVGVKSRSSRFVLDLHQRKELYYDHNPQLGVTKKIMKMGFNSGHLSMADLDLRTIYGNFELNKDLTMAKRRASGHKIEDNHEVEIIDGDKSWFDIHDFSEIGTSSLDGFKSSVLIHPLMYSPSFMYFKKNDHGDKYQINFETGKRTRPFGDENFHECMAFENNSALVQQNSFAQRLEQLRAKKKEKLQDIEELANSTPLTSEKRRQIDQMRLEIKRLEHGLKLVQDIALAYQSRSPNDIVDNSSFDFFVNDDFDKSPFKNKFIIHNMLLKWNDSNRDVVYKYIHLFELKQQISKYMQHRSMGQIDDIIEAQEHRLNGSRRVSRTATQIAQATLDSKGGIDGEADQPCNKSLAETRASVKLKNFEDELYEISCGLSAVVQENFLLQCITPQIQLQSDSYKDSVVLLVSPNIELKVLAFDVNESDNEYHENVIEQRFGAVLTDASAFVFYSDDKATRDNLMFNSSTYGSDEAWPPWLGVELCYDGSVLKNNMLMEKTSVILRYDKPDDSFFVNDKENSTSKLSCDLSQAVFRCDARQYYTLYTIIMNLLIYNEPRNQKLKDRESKMLLRLDVNDISKLKDRIIRLQESIRQMAKIENNLTGRRTILDDLERNDLLVVTNQKGESLLELYLLMRVALMGDSQSKASDDYLEWNIRADDIKLHMLDEDRLPFLDALLTNSHFKRVEGSDRSDRNSVVVERVEIFNLEENAELPILFAPYDVNRKSYKQHPKNRKNRFQERPKPMIQVSWRMDNPVGGIRIIRRFEIELEPLELNLDQILGTKIMKYAFPEESPLLSKNNVDNSDRTEDPNQDSDGNAQNNDDNDETSDENSNDQAPNGKEDSNNHSNGLPSIAIQSSTFRLDEDLPQQQQVSPRKSFFSFRSKDEESFQKGQNSHSGSSDFESGPITGITDDGFHEGEDDEELEEMVQRATNYLSIISFRFKSCLVSITFRGHGAKRLINVSDFAFTLPEIVFTNKTWTLLDLTMAIKKLVIKALLSHGGSIIGNKLAQHKKKRIDGSRSFRDSSSSRISSFRST